MDKRRCIGLIGGLGLGAAVHYYRKLAEAHTKQHLPLDLVMVHAETSRVFEYAGADDREGLAQYLSSFIVRLRSAGADLVVIPAVTPHLCIRELLALSPLPVLNLFDPLVRELSARSVRRVGVFGTRFVIESTLFGMADGVEVVQPPQDEVEYIHRAYLELAETGRGSEAQYRGLTDLALNFCKRDRLDAILLAGTDLSLIFNETNIVFPYIDCAALHIEAILQKVLPQESLSRT
ncbi:MAG TPA: aspartate/glutamate racemase family protein [Candidatus Acidoferrum sp.]|nr:aspartate/glutamate racemase family protein [Candidatus Acidoferrum sp.]